MLMWCCLAALSGTCAEARQNGGTGATAFVVQRSWLYKSSGGCVLEEGYVRATEGARCEGDEHPLSAICLTQGQIVVEGRAVSTMLPASR
jgi:hypothetical protein